MNFLKNLAVVTLALLSAAAFAAVDANKANQAELESIKGIGPAFSTRIIDARKTASFKDWSDLAQRVKGVGQRSATKLSAQGLTVDGAAFTSATTLAAKGATRAPKGTAKGTAKSGPKNAVKAG